jgi:hypothetical protein
VFSAYDVETKDGYAYVAYKYGLAIVDIDPPGSEYVCKHIDFDWPLDVEINGEYAYLPDDKGLSVVDITVPESAYVVKSVKIPYGCPKVAVDGEYAYVANCVNAETWRLLIVDIDPLESGHLVNVVPGDIGFVRNMVADSGYVYMCTYGWLYNSVVVIFDVDPPEFAHYVTKFGAGDTISTDTPAGAITVDNGFLYVPTVGDGLRIYAVDPVESTHKHAEVDTPGMGQDVAISGNYAYVANGYGGLRIIKLW